MFHSLSVTPGCLTRPDPHPGEACVRHSRQCKVVSHFLHGSVAVYTDMFMFTLYMFTGQLYGLEKFWAFLKYSRCKVTIDKRLKQLLSKYKRLEDFRVEVGVCGSYSSLTGGGSVSCSHWFYKCLVTNFESVDHCFVFPGVVNFYSLAL